MSDPAPKRARIASDDSCRLTASKIACPPTEQDLINLTDLPIDDLPRKYRRTHANRVFVNRELSLCDIQWFGFDMDYTLAEYVSETYEALCYDLTVKRLVVHGYPAEIETLFQYNPSFGIRGLFFDKLYGNLVKIDEDGNVMRAMHGYVVLTQNELDVQYPSSFVHSDEIGQRYYVLNTLFNLPETALLADLINYYDNQTALFTRTSTGVQRDNIFLSYANIFSDVRQCIDYIHQFGNLKALTVADLPRYVKKTPRLLDLLREIRRNGRKTMLITNSGYEYTEKLMTYLCDFPDNPASSPPSNSSSSQSSVSATATATAPASSNWRKFFDVIIVDAKKPLFFAEGSVLREVDSVTGSLKIGSVTGGFRQNVVYSGGSSDILAKITGVKGNEILYLGDHIFGDILKSKKEHGWRTFLVVPELTRELSCWRQTSEQFVHLKNLEWILAESYRDLDCHSVTAPDTDALNKHMERAKRQIDDTYNRNFGSMFRSGSRQTFFAKQARRYADLYASTIYSILNYPFCYLFRSVESRLAHEDHIVQADDTSRDEIL